MDRNRFGIYVHIPFCVRKCNYCDFLSFAADGETQRRYIDALCEEIRGFGGEGRSAASIFFGGGTPSVLDADLIADVMRTIESTFSVADDAEITIECNPETLTREKADSYLKCGINRISFGLQAVDNDVLRAIGRIHTYEKFLESFKLARESGFKNINVDMMAALPGQTVESYLAGLEKVVQLSPEHISAYSLIVEEGTQLCDHLKDYAKLPDEDEERQMYHGTLDLLESYGYHRYEISNYAKDGFDSRHNKSYWELTDYIGVGLGASGFYKGCRYTNTTDMEKYLEGLMLNRFTESCQSRLEHRADYITEKYDAMRDITVETCEDMMEEFMFLGLRKMEGVSYAEFAAIFGCDIKSVYAAQIEKNCRNGLLEEYTATDSSVHLRLTPRGIDISNSVMAEFMLA